MIVYAVNNYVYALLKKNLGWGPITSKNLVPFLPAQQQPEALNQQKPFAIYLSSLEYNDGNLEPEDSEIITYVFYSNGPDKETDIDDAVTLVKNAFKAFDSADNINTWLRNPVNTTIAPQDKDSFITFTSVMDAQSSGDTDSEGGRVDGLVQVRVGYQTTPIDYSI